MDRISVAVCSAVGLLAALPGTGAPVAAPAHVPASAKYPAGCLQSGNGYLRARIRGALNLDIDWHNAEIECDGGSRPDGSGIREPVPVFDLALCERRDSVASLTLKPARRTRGNLLRSGKFRT